MPMRSMRNQEADSDDLSCAEAKRQLRNSRVRAGTSSSSEGADGATKTSLLLNVKGETSSWTRRCEPSGPSLRSGGCELVFGKRNGTRFYEITENFCFTELAT